MSKSLSTKLSTVVDKMKKRYQHILEKNVKKSYKNEVWKLIRVYQQSVINLSIGLNAVSAGLFKIFYQKMAFTLPRKWPLHYQEKLDIVGFRIYNIFYDMRK